MKKNISVISMDSVLQEWLLQKLIKEPPESDSAKELLSGIYYMISGDVNSLLLSTTKNSENESLNLSDEMKIGELVINPKSRSVIRMGQAVSLTPKEFDILYFLAENRGEVFTKEVIEEIKYYNSIKATIVSDWNSTDEVSVVDEDNWEYLKENDEEEV